MSYINNSIHVHCCISCDGCGINPIKGSRYNCLQCPDYDMCDRCKPRVAHPPEHLLVEVKNGLQTSTLYKLKEDVKKIRKGTEPKDISWIPNTSVGHKEYAVPAGYDSGENEYVARVHMYSGVIPGRLPESGNSVHVPFGGKEIIWSEYEVLVAPTGCLSWVPCTGGRIPNNAIPGGNDPNGEKYFIGRAIHNGALCIGKVHPNHQGCYVAYGGKEHHYRFYEILCRNGYYRAVTTAGKLEGPAETPDCVII